MKNSLAPINRIPPEVLSLIPDNFDEDGSDKTLIALTHVCHGWRDTFISRSSLWTRLDFADIDKTRTYIQRSQSSPLAFHFFNYKVIDDAFALVIPHVRRLKSLTIRALRRPSVLEHLRCRAPLLEELDIHFLCDLVLEDTLFDGDLSSLRELRLSEVIAPWKNLANLRVIHLRSTCPSYGTTQILDLFESAPLLHTAWLQFPMPRYPTLPPSG